MLEMYINYRRAAEKKAAAEPKRIIFYRGAFRPNTAIETWTNRSGVVDGVSEGEFQQVLDLGLYRERIISLLSLLTNMSDRASASAE